MRSFNENWDGIRRKGSREILHENALNGIAPPGTTPTGNIWKNPQTGSYLWNPTTDQFFKITNDKPAIYGDRAVRKKIDRQIYGNTFIGVEATLRRFPIDAKWPDPFMPSHFGDRYTNLRPAGSADIIYHKIYRAWAAFLYTPNLYKAGIRAGLIEMVNENKGGGFKPEFVGMNLGGVIGNLSGGHELIYTIDKLPPKWGGWEYMLTENGQMIPHRINSVAGYAGSSYLGRTFGKYEDVHKAIRSLV
jgi:hypothetical protein